jgi:hypothetical protein
VPISAIGQFGSVWSSDGIPHLAFNRGVQREAMRRTMPSAVDWTSLSLPLRTFRR